MPPEHAPLFRSGDVSDRALRPAQLRTQQTPCKRLVSQPGGEHYPASDRRHRATPEASGYRQLAGFRVATGRTCEVELLTRGLGRLFPAGWARFRDGVPLGGREGSLAAAYSRLLADPDPAVRAKAARDWCDWEEAMLPTSGPNPRYADPEFRLAFARLVTHYWSHDHFLPYDGVLLDEARLLGSVPGVLVQGNLDLVNLLGTPWQLTAAWPGSELVLIDDAGHGGNASLSAAIVAATDRFARALSR